MKLVQGYFLPATDTHFEAHLNSGPRLFDRGTYQHAKLKACIDQLPKRNRFRAIDVGAHIGLWSWPLSHYFDHVVAYEPNPFYWDCWTKNMQGRTNARLYSFGLGNTQEVRHMAGTSENSGMSHVDDEGDIEIYIRRFDDSTTTVSIDFVKLDCEGFELPALQGMELHLKAFRPFVLVEQKPGNGKRYGYSDDAAVRYLVDDLGGRVVFEMHGDYGIRL